MKEKANIVVLGGGLIGSAICYFLSQRTRGIVLVEAEDLGAGASGACDGLLFTQTKLPGPHLELALRSARLYEELDVIFGEEIELDRAGGLVVAETEAEWEALKEAAPGRAGRTARNLGGNVEILSAKGLLNLEPALNPNLVGASFSSVDGQVNPLALNFALARAAKERGAILRLFWKVRAIERKKRKGGYSLKGEKGEIEADKVIVAAGVETPFLLKPFGLDIPIIPRRGQILVTEKAPRILGHPFISASYLRAKFATPEEKEKLDFGLSIEQTKVGNFLIGSTREFVGFDKRPSWPAIRLLASQAQRVLPCLKGLSIIRTFAGLRPYTPDGLPVLGEVPGLSGLYLASGHEGDGVMLAPITGKLITELLLEESVSFDLAPFRVERFQGK